MTFLSFWGLPYHVLWNLDEALSSPLPGKQTKGSRVSATHCTPRGADCVCNTLVPETGPPFWKPFPSSSNIAVPFLGPVFGPIFGTTKEQTGAARRSWRPGFRPFAGASIPSAMQADMDTHSRIILYIIVIDLNMSSLLSITQLKIVQKSWSFSNRAQTLEFLHHKLRAAALAWC